jgi:exopolyphosphatase / guanosine-5'-triphosphate,3'-diphosphate pyrophosphatase
VEHRSKSQGLNRSPAATASEATIAALEARPDEQRSGTVAVIDIGSNSVRLVAYEGLTRSPAPIFNEKVLAGLGRGVASTGILPEDGVKDALQALRRFRGLAEVMRIDQVHVLATAASRDASNGAEFLTRAEDILGARIDLISGPREAKLSALGVISGIGHPDGLVGDLGGGSLELISVHGERIGAAVSLRLGGLALLDNSGGSLKKAEKLVKEAFKPVRQFEAAQDREFYAVGGTWRALAKLHMLNTGYQLNVMHGYSVAAKEMSEFCRMVLRVDASALSHVDAVSSARRPLLAYGALLLEEIIRQANPKRIVFSATGVREGLLYELLPETDRKQDALIEGARVLNSVRSRSPRHGEDLCAWTDALLSAAEIDETVEEARLRHAACLVSDVGWRAHPDYRGELSYNMIAHAALTGVDHPGRVYMALAVFFRHVGLTDIDMPGHARALASSRLIERAKILGAAMRVAYILSAAMAGILPRTAFVIHGGKLRLHIPASLSALAGDRLNSRLRQLSRILGREMEVSISG